MMMTLQEMQARWVRLGNVEAFARAYPHPALTLRIPAAPGTAPAKVKVPRLNDTVGDEGVAALLGDPLERTHVTFLLKSERNPFANIISLGRATTNDLCVPHGSVSKVHAVFTRLGDAWRIGDRKAKNGLYVNRVEVEPGGTADLEDGALISFGSQVEGTFHTPRGLFGFLDLIKNRR
jgi:hypothetical protein